MARNSSGTHSLPLPDVVYGTTISDTHENTTLSDISTEITDSLSRSGKGGMLSALRGVDGSDTAPAFSFTSETGTGMYRAGANDARMQVGGTSRSKWTAAGFFADVITALTATYATLKGAMADGATAIGAVIDTTISLAATGAKLLSVRNAGSEKAYISKDGAIYAAAVEPVSATAATGWTMGGEKYSKTAGLVSLHCVASVSGAATTLLLSLPADARPVITTTYFTCRLRIFAANAWYTGVGSITNGGSLSVAEYISGTTLATYTPALNDNVYFNVVFPVV